MVTLQSPTTPTSESPLIGSGTTTEHPKTLKRLLFDLETDGLLPELTKIHCLVLVDPESDDEPETYHNDVLLQPRHGTLRDGVSLLRSADVLSGHNVSGFDLPALLRCGDAIQAGAVEDTIVWSRLVFSDRKEQDFGLRKKHRIDPKYIGQHSLGSWGNRLGIAKGEYTGDFKEFTQEMLDYCIQDVKVNRALWRFLRPLLPQWVSPGGISTVQIESFFNQFCLDLETVGVQVDERAADILLGVLLRRRAELDDELHRTFPPVRVPYAVNARTGKQTYRVDGEGTKVDHKLVPFNPGSRQQLADRLIAKYGWVPEDFTKTGDPVMAEEVLLGLSDIYPEAKVAGERYVVQSRIGMLEEGQGAYLRLCDKQGRLHGRTIHIGTVTHRCAHKQPNQGNITSVDKPYGLEMRRLFLPFPGMILAGGDASQIELRLLGHYLAPWDGGAYAQVVDSGDVHMLHCGAINAGTGLGLVRNASKGPTYAWLYGAQDERLGRIVGCDRKMGAKIRKALRTKIDGMAPLLKELEEIAAGRRYILSLDKRRVGLRKSHAALNTLLQSAGAVVMRWQPYFLKYRLEEAGIRWGTDYIPHLHVHDELQGSLRPQYMDAFRDAFTRAFEDTRAELGLRVPLRCEVKFGKNWAETH
jgi:DNA polymerase-1